MRSTSTLSSSPHPKELAVLADKVTKDPKLLEQLSERVYELFQENLRHQHEQLEHYKRGRSLV